MKKKGLSILSLLILLMTYIAPGNCTSIVHNELNTNEIDVLAGQWNYELLTQDGTRINGFFQIQPSDKKKLTVIGQAYFDKGTGKLSVKNLRGLWEGALQKDKQKKNYILTFTMQENPIFSDKNPSEKPYQGTIYFHQKNNLLEGKFFDHGSREGINGTIKAYKSGSNVMS